MSFAAIGLGGLGVAGLSAAGNIIGAGIQADAAGKSAEKQAAAAREANALQERMFNQQRADQEPWRQTGISALYGSGGMFRRKDGGSGLVTKSTGAKDRFIQSKLAEFKQGAGKAGGVLGAVLNSPEFESKMRQQAEAEWANSGQNDQGVDFDQYELDPELTRNFTASDFQKDPGYEFRMAEGQKALERSAAARGGLQSGGTLRALSRYGQDYASNEYTNAYNRFNADKDRRFNRLSALAGIGQTANSQVAAAGQNYAGQVGSNLTNLANAQGAAGMASANVWGNALSGIGRMGMDMYSMSQPSWMDRQLQTQNTGSTSYGGGRTFGLLGRS